MDVNEPEEEVSWDPRHSLGPRAERPSPGQELWGGGSPSGLSFCRRSLRPRLQLPFPRLHTLPTLVPEGPSGPL